MKKLMLMALAIVAFATSCSKSDVPSIESGTNKVAVSFVYEEPTDSRSSFRVTESAATWEKSLSSVTIYAFEETGAILIQRTFSSDEVASKKAEFTIPHVKVGDNCEFYAVANIETADIMTKENLLDAIEKSNVYNDVDYDKVNSSSVRTAGFVMSGTTKQAIVASGEKTQVSIILKRTVAKIAVETSVSEEFGKKYGGIIRVNSAEILKSASQSKIVSQDEKGTGSMTFTCSQTSKNVLEKSHNLFYLFENSELAGNSRVTLLLKTTYDKDGDIKTDLDQVNVEYTVSLEGSASGVIIRNGYYRVLVNITGLIGSDTTVKLEVADWETAVTQSINVGN